MPDEPTKTLSKQPRLDQRKERAQVKLRGILRLCRADAREGHNQQGCFCSHLNIHFCYLRKSRSLPAPERPELRFLLNPGRKGRQGPFLDLP